MLDGSLLPVTTPERQAIFQRTITHAPGDRTRHKYDHAIARFQAVFCQCLPEATTGAISVLRFSLTGNHPAGVVEGGGVGLGVLRTTGGVSLPSLSVIRAVVGVDFTSLCWSAVDHEGSSPSRKRATPTAGKMIPMIHSCFTLCASRTGRPATSASRISLRTCMRIYARPCRFSYTFSDRLGGISTAWALGPVARYNQVAD